MDGDGIGGSEINLGSGSETNTREQCVELVVRTQPNANGVTYSGRSTGGNTCYAEFGATGTSGGTSWQTCIFGQGNITCPYDLTLLTHNIIYKQFIFEAIISKYYIFSMQP